jgi:type II secretion system protein L
LQGVLRESGAPQAVIVYGSDQIADTQLLPEELRDRVQWRRGNLCAALLLSDTGELNLNLLQGDFAPRLPLVLWWRQWRAVAAVLAAAFLLQLAAAYAEYRSLSTQNLALRGAVEESYRKAFPQGAVVDAEKQLRRQLDALGGTGLGSGFVALMDRVGGAIAGMPGTTIASINYNDKGDEMRLNITAADFEGVEMLRSRINEAGLEAIMESSSTQGARVSARLRVTERL